LTEELTRAANRFEQASQCRAKISSAASDAEYRSAADGLVKSARNAQSAAVSRAAAQFLDRNPQSNELKSVATR
jgi:hypothetical protein